MKSSIKELCIRWYDNPLIERNRISMDNTGKTGIYILISKSTNRVYIGSAVNLSNRLNDYFQESYLKNRKNTFIVRELNKYGMENFSIGILEYTSSIKKEILLREQYWLDLKISELNILQYATNTQGFKHSDKTKMHLSLIKSGGTHTIEVRERMSVNRMGKKNSFFGKKRRD